MGLGWAPKTFAILFAILWSQQLRVEVGQTSLAVTTRGDYKNSFTILIIQEQVKHRTKKRKRSRFELRQSQGGVSYVWLSGEYSTHDSDEKQGIFGTGFKHEHQPRCHHQHPIIF